MTSPLGPGAAILVIGGGVVGTSTAYALADAGYTVTLITAESIGDGASAGNAGLVVPADSTVWPGPANARAVPDTLLGRGGSSITVSWRNPRVIPWGLRFLANSTQRKYESSCAAAHALSAHSLSVAQEWASTGDLGTRLARTGMVFLYGSAADIAEARHTRAPLSEAGETYRELTRKELVDIDAAYDQMPDELRVSYGAGAASGDSHLFANGLAGRLRSAGGTVLEREPVTEVVCEGGRVVGVRLTDRELTADAVVLAAGTATPRLARTAGVCAHILPVKGYAATVPIIHPDRAPTVGGVLETKHVAFSRMGDAVRLSTGAEIGCRDHDTADAVKQYIAEAGESLFPGALDWPAAIYRAEHRPMTPSGLPLIGPTRIRGLYLNAGHGSLGWTQAAGSADVLSRLIQGAAAPIDVTPFQPTAPADTTRTPALHAD